MIVRWVRRVLRPIGSLLGAVMLGVGTLFQPKTRPEDHWSKGPKVEVFSESEQAAAGPPPNPRRRSRQSVAGA